MLTALYKFLFVGTSVAASIYSMSVFGAGMWSWIFLGVAAFVLLSVLVAHLDTLAIIVAKVSAALAAIALVLLMVAGTVGGSFNLSESNVIFAVLLAMLCVFGLAAFFWDDRQSVTPSHSPNSDASDGN